MAEIQLHRPFDIVGPTNLTRVWASDGIGYDARELEVSGTAVRILTSLRDEGQAPPSQPIQLNWMVYGIRDAHTLPTWWLQLYAAVENAAKWIWPPALINYATAFEDYVETFLVRVLTDRYGRDVADYVLSEKKFIVDRVKGVMKLATGHTFSEQSNSALYQEWDDNVRIPRNKLGHGDPITTDGNDVEKAHQAVIRAIQWIENLAPAPPP